jgi:hypothetical protein
LQIVSPDYFEFYDLQIKGFYVFLWNLELSVKSNWPRGDFLKFLEVYVFLLRKVHVKALDFMIRRFNVFLFPPLPPFVYYIFIT